MVYIYCYMKSPFSILYLLLIAFVNNESGYTINEHQDHIHKDLSL
jgi:hypothetical protein